MKVINTVSLIGLFREEPSLRRPRIILLCLLATVLVGERLLTIAVAGVGVGSSEFPWWLPDSGSIGKTMVFSGTLFDFLKFVVIPAVLLWLAYQYSRHSVDN